MTVPIAVIANLILIAPLLEGSKGAQFLFAMETGWLLLATIGFVVDVKGTRWRLPYFCYYFSYIHIAACIAVVRVLLGHRTVSWKPTT